MGWLNNWLYRKQVQIKRTSGSLSDYTLKINVGQSIGSSNYNVHCNDKCLQSFDDIRFTSSDGETLLSYYIESISGETPNQTSIIWVNFISIETTDTTFYIYYGNTQASSYSNGVNTFPFFDDFSGSVLNTDKWDTNGSPSIQSDGSLNVLYMSASSQFYVRSKSTMLYGPGYGTRIRIKTNYYNTLYDQSCGFCYYSNYFGLYTFFSNPNNPNDATLYNGTHNATDMGANWSANTYGIVEFNHYAAQNNVIIVNEQEIINNTSINIGSNNKGVLLYVGYGGGSPVTMVDWVYVRKIVTDEPTFSEWGSEESNYKLITAKNFRSFRIDGEPVKKIYIGSNLVFERVKPPILVYSWATTSSLNVSRYALAGCGDVNNALSFCGWWTLSVTEKWSGSSWVTTSSVINGTSSLAGCGDVNNALKFGGHPYTASEKWSGSSWTTTNSLNINRSNTSGCGNVNGALCIGGVAGGQQITSTEKWSGSSWVTTNGLNVARNFLSGCGDVNNALSFGGDTSGTINGVNTTEKWSGSSWVTTNGLNVARNKLAGCGDVNNALSFGGYNGSYLNTTEKWSGSSWATTSNLTVAVAIHTGCGDVNGALCIGGTSATEKWSGS